MTRTASTLLLSALFSLSTAAVANGSITSSKEPPAKKATPVAAPAKAVQPAPTSLGNPRALEWEDLLPEQEKGSYSATPPPPTHDYLSGESGLAAQQQMNFSVNKTLEGQWVKVPGFIVPLELDAEGKVTEFFLVPYFGACIHVPPPPPNQMAYVILKKGVTLESLYAAFWVTGQLTTKTKSTRLGAAAYTITATSLEDYQY